MMCLKFIGNQLSNRRLVLMAKILKLRTLNENVSQKKMTINKTAKALAPSVPHLFNQLNKSLNMKLKWNYAKKWDKN